LGGGKTTLSKGIAKGLGSQDVVSSPTFTVSNVYDAKNDIKVYHFDFYRLQEGGVVEQELRELSEDPKVVILIEWGDIIDESLPADMIRISIDRVSSGEDNRQVIVDIPDKYKYLWGLL
jgi:tRNA threonylcarbamoyladenosine biosynthesis protein TsaE